MFSHFNPATGAEVFRHDLHIGNNVIRPVPIVAKRKMPPLAESYAQKALCKQSTVQKLETNITVIHNEIFNQIPPPPPSGGGERGGLGPSDGSPLVVSPLAAAPSTFLRRGMAALGAIVRATCSLALQRTRRPLASESDEGVT